MILFVPEIKYFSALIYSEAVNKAKYFVYLAGHRDFRENCINFENKVILDAVNIFFEDKLPESTRYYLFGKSF
jgi:hypothetical protein